jgi:ABC-type Na+ efflux pump permease subunit
MSDPDSPLSRVLLVLVIVFGCIMLLPGICAVLTTAMVFATAHDSFNFGLLALWLLALAVSFAGIVLIRWGTRRLGR